MPEIESVLLCGYLYVLRHTVVTVLAQIEC